jgi:hypothetical protein
MKQNNNAFWAFVGLVVAVVAVGIVIKYRVEAPTQSASLAPAVMLNASDSSAAGGDTNSSGDGLGIAGPSAQPSADVGETVTNAAGGYSFAVPSTWYVEKNDVSGVVVYPDYDPSGSVSPDCKIEVSKLDGTIPNNSTTSGELPISALNSFVTSDLHADPTVDISEMSRLDTRVGGAPAVRWEGNINDAATTLVYVLSRGSVFEIVPSDLDAEAAAANDESGYSDCNLMLAAVLESMQFGK